MRGRCSMMTFQVNASLLPTANKALTSDRGSSCSHPGLEAPCPAYRSSERGVENIRTKLPLIQPLSSPLTQLERTKTSPGDTSCSKNNRGSLHPFSLSKELSHSRGGRPFTLGYDLTSSPAHVFPSSLILSGRNSFSVESCKLSRPKVNYPTYSLLHSKDNQKSEFNMISELSSLEGETVRQEKLKREET
ncbi:hypothetical protein F7725_028487 [Dissostichus mawsoni]|uniref:Uncharacterized protein n=1 Tax=Dissostichus mawsoni TaxID=36200 RepID=A0A7J5XH43_DISMA|nr:hypothetical protein F7725_028487 [Dissostichus mawsoni]